MTTDSIQDLVKRLRAIDHTSVEDCFLQSPYFHKAADALEAMAGEVEAYESARVTWAESMRAWINRATVAESERDRLKAALVEVEDRLNCRGNPDIAHYCPNCDNSLHNARAIARKALGGDAS